MSSEIQEVLKPLSQAAIDALAAGNDRSSLRVSRRNMKKRAREADRAVKRGEAFPGTVTLPQRKA